MKGGLFVISAVLVLRIRLGFFGTVNSGALRIRLRFFRVNEGKLWSSRFQVGRRIGVYRSPDANTPRTASQFSFYLEQLPGKLLAIYLSNQSKSPNYDKVNTVNVFKCHSISAVNSNTSNTCNTVENLPELQI